MLSIKKSFLSFLFYLPLMLALFNGHQVVHAFDENDHSESEEICLICELQQDQEEEYFLLPSTDKFVVTTFDFPLLKQFAATRISFANSVSSSHTTRPPPFV